MRLAPTRGLIPRSKAEGSLSLHIDRFHVSHASGQHPAQTGEKCFPIAPLPKGSSKLAPQPW